MKPMAAAVAGAAISGVAMYAVGMRVPQAEAFETPALVQTVDGEYVALARPVGYTTALQPAAVPVARPVAQRVSQRRASAPQRTVYRPVQPAQEDRVVVREEQEESGRSWQKTALIIGGAAASGAGVGAMVDGKKGALIGAAVGGGAASIYEATRRR